MCAEAASFSPWTLRKDCKPVNDSIEAARYICTYVKRACMCRERVSCALFVSNSYETVVVLLYVYVSAWYPLSLSARMMHCLSCARAGEECKLRFLLSSFVFATTRFTITEGVTRRLHVHVCMCVSISVWLPSARSD